MTNRGRLLLILRMPYKNAIAITIDNNYVQHACVMLLSLSANITENVNVYCIYSDLNETSKKRIVKELKGSRININFVEFNTAVLPHLPIKTNDHVSAAAFLRIWLPDLFPDFDQLLFIDTDIVINGDLTELLNFTVPDQPLAAIPDTGMSVEKRASLSMAPDVLYFNSGVMVLNLAYFRQHELTQQIARFIDEYPELCEFWDQDAFNAVIKGNFYVLDFKYNVLGAFYEAPQTDAAILKAMENPVTIHYTGGGKCKPWMYQNEHPHQGLYYKYLKLSSFRGYIPPDLPRSWRIFRKLKFRLFYK